MVANVVFIFTSNFEQIFSTFETSCFKLLDLQDAIENQSFLKDPLVIKKGDVENAFENSDHIIEGEVRLGGQEHFYLETQCSLAIPKGEANEMEVYASSQSLSHTQVSVLLGGLSCFNLQL